MDTEASSPTMPSRNWATGRTYCRKFFPTPPYGKRMLLDNGWYRAVARDNVTLVTERLAQIRGQTLVASGGGEYEADIVVLATGFRAVEFLASLEVIGREGRILREFWGEDDARAYLGATIRLSQSVHAARPECRAWPWRERHQGCRASGRLPLERHGVHVRTRGRKRRGSTGGTSVTTRASTKPIREWCGRIRAQTIGTAIRAAGSWR